MDNEIVKSVLWLVAVMAATFAGLAYVARSQCYAKWSADFEPEWGVFSNCIITVDGARIPSENYRDF